jgi:hypothetical protein
LNATVFLSSAGMKRATLSVFVASIQGMSAMAMAISREMMIVAVLYTGVFYELDEYFLTNC